MPNITSAETPKDTLRAIGGEGTVRASRWQETAGTRMDGKVASGWSSRQKVSDATTTGVKCPL